MKLIQFNPREHKYKAPFGAISTETNVQFNIYIDRQVLPCQVTLVIVKDNGEVLKKYNCLWYDRDAGYDIYNPGEVNIINTGLYFYYFKIIGANGIIYYDARGMVQKPEQKYQLTVYDKAYKTPDWAKNAIMYHIFIDRFYHGGDMPATSHDKRHIIHKSWNEEPLHKPTIDPTFGELWNNDFFGGNLLGICEKLGYLSDLGINLIYLSPMFKGFSNHKYDTGSYEEIDPGFGTEEDFKLLCAEAKKLGIRLILDGVFSHTGSDSKYFNKDGTYDSIGAYQSAASPYYSWYSFISHPNDYHSWWGIKTLPNVNEDNPDYLDYILRDKDAIIKKWLNAGADGWRLDVADELPDIFLDTLREQVKKTNPDALIIGEVWEDATTKFSYGNRRKYLLGEQLDGVMNYPFRSAVLDFLLGNITASSFNAILWQLYENYPRQAFSCVMNFLGTHDTERALTLLGQGDCGGDRDGQARVTLKPTQKEMAIKRLKLATIILFSFPGIPCVFYGDEALLEGCRDPFNRRTFPWDKQDEKMQSWYKRLIQIRKHQSSLSDGEYIPIDFNNEEVLGFMRRSGEQTIITFINRNLTDTASISHPLFEQGVLGLIGKPLIHKNNEGETVIELLPCSGNIVVC